MRNPQAQAAATAVVMTAVTPGATRAAWMQHSTLRKPAQMHLGAPHGAHQGHSSRTLIKDTHQGHQVCDVILTAWAARSLSSSSGATKYGAPLFDRLSHLSACALEMSSFRT